jgi:putative selenate reductase
MSDLFQPIAADQLVRWVLTELDTHDSAFGIPRQHFFVPTEETSLRRTVFGHPLETPFGPAAGPHSQMAQNIVASWLCGARYIELKTVQTLDVLNVSKPCIDMQDEGYNVEWSQELKINQSFEEYLRAWVLIHALHHKLGFPGDAPGIVFNLSVGYDLEGIQKPNMQWFLDQMQDCSEHKQFLVDQVATFYPAVRELSIPDRISDNVTLSTMHGCPPGEIESISTYLMKERGLHTLVKCNPTLLGPDRVRTILNEELQYTDIVVPDVAFEHDLKYPDAVTMLDNLQAVAKECGLDFGVKLSNTLEVENSRPVFDESEKMMYLSGRPLHAVTVHLAKKLADEFDGCLPMSFSAGANCFNAPDLLAAGMQTITVCSDLLKTGGYLRLLQYIETVSEAFNKANAGAIDEFILKSAKTDESLADTSAAALLNLHHYAERVCSEPQYIKSTFDTSHTKTSRELGLFDCIKAPCIDECPIDQKVPQYMSAVRDGNTAEALRIVRSDNPLACVLGRVCDHLCEGTCIRAHLDEPLAIRDIKRFISDFKPSPTEDPRTEPGDTRVAIIGAGPGGMAAASELATAGAQVEVFEEHPYAGGMVSGAVPEYRLPWNVFNRDFSLLEDLGVQFHFGVRAGRDISLSQLRADGFDKIVIMVGAQLGKTLGLEGEDCDGVIDALQFLRRARESKAMNSPRHVGVIGAGDTAMDCARVAKRQSDCQVSLIYRRTIDQMPADREEITHLLDEDINVLELCKPQRLVVADGKLQALECRRMMYKGDRDASGRKIPHEIPDSDFEVPLDTLILAISQHAVLDFFGEEPIAVNDRGYIDVDPATFETSVAGVYAGGDVVNDGPASIVKAVAAGKAIADAILQRQLAVAETPLGVPTDVPELLRRRSHREWRIPAAHVPLEDRDDSTEVVLTFDAQQARVEAARCLDCDTYCSLCVGVCPNLALLTYESGDSVEDGTVQQPFQVAVLADLCNECGNCTTFCPTAGRPWRDKPRLYLDRPEFEAQQDNAFMLFRNDGQWAMDARWQGATHRIELDANLVCTDDNPAATEPYKSMRILLRSLAKSVPYLPALYKE